MDSKERQKILDKLAAAIRSSWARETSADPDNWTPENPAWGQCAVTALIVHDYLKGQFLRTPLLDVPDPKVAAMRSHYHNYLYGGFEVDLTREQFSEDVQKLLRVGYVRFRKEVLDPDNPKHQGTLTRYNLLKSKVTKAMGEEEKPMEIDDQRFVFGIIGNGRKRHIFLRASMERGPSLCLRGKNQNFISAKDEMVCRDCRKGYPAVSLNTDLY